MKRRVLFIPRAEVEEHLKRNERQDIKIVISKILHAELAQILEKQGKIIKSEQHLQGDIWKHSEVSEANNICESTDFFDDSLAQYGQAPFGIAFVNEKATQDEHYHEKHWEIYFSEHAIGANYRYKEDTTVHSEDLQDGGAIIFSPNTVHKMRLSGFTIVIEVPAVHRDKIRIKR